MQTGISEKFGSSGVSFDTIPGYQVKKSRFNLSFLKKGTIDVGEIKLLCCVPCVPNSSHDINLRYLLKSFPLVVPPSTNYKVVTHFYFCSYESLWKGAETFVTKGRSSNITLEIPNAALPDGPMSYRDVTLDGTSVLQPGDYTVPRSLAVPASLWCDFDLPPLYYPNASTGSYSTMYLPSLKKSELKSTGRKMISSNINLLPAFAYQKIYRSNYVSPNLLQNNKVWFPDDISSEEWRIDFNSSNLRSDLSTNACLFVPIGSTMPSSNFISSTVPYVGEKQSDGTYLGDNVVNIWQKRYAMFPNDRFMDSKPWLVRGEETTVEADVTQLSANTTISGKLNVTEMHGGLLEYSQQNESTAGTVWSTYPGPDVRSQVTVDGSKLIANTTVGGAAQLSLTANKLRTLMALSIKSEIDALTNGNYNPMISAQFGVDPKHVDFDPYFLGGTVDYIQMNEITQTSASDSSPLGTQGALARGQSSGHICNFFCRDFGYILGVMIISPDVVYCQGIDRMWTDIDQDSVFFPIYNELGFEPIRNQELYISGTASTDQGLYGYTTRNSHMKVNMNKATGFMALPPDVDALFAAYSQTREFSSLPKLSQELLTMSPGNIRRDYLHFTSYPAYRLDFAIDDSGILPLPYSSVPNRMGF